MKVERGKWKVERLPKAVASLSTFLFPLSTLFSCGNDMKDISRFEPQNLPDQEIVDAHVWRSDEGQLQLELTAPRIVRLRDPDARTIYPQGVDVRFFNAERQLTTTIHANRATSYDEKDILVASDSVVVIDYANGDTVYLQEIVWNSREDLIYSNHPVKSVNGRRVTYGDGFVSDGKMTNLRIKHQRGVIEFEE
jgi:LPS export ABC transporter protein LptC